MAKQVPGEQATTIQQAYLAPLMRSRIKQAFRAADPPVIALGQFLTPAALAQAKKVGGWKHTTIPDHYAYDAGKKIPTQHAIGAWVKRTLGVAPLDEGRRRFGHRDYTLLHDDEPQRPGVVALLFLDAMREEWGGQVVLVKDGETLARFTPQDNTLLLIRREKGAHLFIQYVNHHAKNGVRMLSG